MKKIILSLFLLFSVFAEFAKADTACSSSSPTKCAGEQFCLTPTGSCESAGVCKAKPDMCTEIYQPVCGCDGKTYSNECAAHSRGQSVKKDGACEENKGK